MSISYQNYNTELNRTVQKTEFNILDHLDRVQVVKETSHDYHGLCPSCNESGFKIDKKTGKYQGFKCGCKTESIREAIKPWSEVVQESKANQKSVKPKQYRAWEYKDRFGNPLVKVCRSDNGNGKKSIWQEHWNGNQWTKGIGSINKEDVPIYNYREIRQAIARSETIYIVEGESCCDALHKLGLTATTNLGGAGKWLESHFKDVEGASVVLVPDRDIPGIKHMEAIAKRIPNCSWLYAFPDSPLWGKKLPSSQGLDVADWIEHGATKEQIINSVVAEPKRLNLGETAIAAEQKSSSNETKSLAEGLLNSVDSLLNRDLSESQLKAQIIEIASIFGKSARDIWSLFYSRSSEIEAIENVNNTKQDVDNLLKIQSYQLDLKKYLQPNLAKPLEKLAVYLGVNNATLLTTLLTASASLLPITTKLELIRDTNFYAKPILYAGISAPSGSGKSPAIKAILQPLFDLQAEEDHRYSLELEDYELQFKNYKKSAKGSDIDEPDPPSPPREYFVTDSTSEAIAQIQNNQQNNGFLGYFDELKQLLGQVNSYRSGKGADIEKLLSGRDGSGFKINRASGKRISCPQSGYSLLGGIQPDVLRKQMGDFSDGNGFWARFIWVNQEMQKKPFPDDEVKLDVSPLLRSLYEFLGKIDNTFILSKEAKDVYRDWYLLIEDRKLQESRSAMQSVLSKSQRLAGELALLLHCLKYAAHEIQPTEQVERDTMVAAINLTKFYINQIKLIHSEGNPDDGDSSLYSRLINLSKQKGWLTARTVKQAIWQLKDKTPTQVRSLFKKLADLGYGEISGSGSRTKWIFQSVENCRGTVEESVEESSTVLKTSESTANTLIQKTNIENCRGTVDKCRGTVEEKIISEPHTAYSIERKTVEDSRKNNFSANSMSNSSSVATVEESYTEQKIINNKSEKESSTVLAHSLDGTRDTAEKKSSTVPLQLETSNLQNTDSISNTASVEETVDDTSTVSKTSTVSEKVNSIFNVGDRVKVKGTKIIGTLIDFFEAGKTWRLKTDPDCSVPYESVIESRLEVVV